MLTSQGQSAVLCSSTMLPLSEYILEIYVLCSRVTEDQSWCPVRPQWAPVSSVVVRAHHFKNIYRGLILTEKLTKSWIRLISFVFSEPSWPSLMMSLLLMVAF